MAGPLAWRRAGCRCRRLNEGRCWPPRLATGGASRRSRRSLRCPSRAPSPPSAPHAPRSWDVAVITLAKPLGQLTGYMGVAAGCGKNLQMTTAGYPQDKSAGTCMAAGCYQPRLDCDSPTNQHSCDTKNGMSGAPMWDGKSRVRMIHVAGVEGMPENRATTLTQVGGLGTPLRRWGKGAVGTGRGRASSAVQQKVVRQAGERQARAAPAVLCKLRHHCHPCRHPLTTCRRPLQPNHSSWSTPSQSGSHKAVAP